MPGESKDDHQCVRFVHLDRPSTANEMSKACRRELRKNVGNTWKSSLLRPLRRVGVLKIDTEEQLGSLLKLVELEPIELRNAAWLLQLSNRTSFGHLFQHRPLFDSSCYQLLPREVLEPNERFRRNEERLTGNELINEPSKSASSTNVASHFVHEFDCGTLAEFAVCSYRIETVTNNRSMAIGRDAFLEIVTDEQVEHRTGKKIKMDIDGTEEMRRTEMNRDEKLRTEFEKVEKEAHLEAFVGRMSVKGRQMNSRSQNKIEQQPPLPTDSNDGNVENSGHSLRFDGRSRLSHLRVTDLSWTEGHSGKLGEYELNDGEATKDGSRPGENDTMRRHYQVTFDLVGKLQLIFISLNLLLFVCLCIRLNQNRNARALQESTSSTHVHFENYDHSLQFGPFDSI